MSRTSFVLVLAMVAAGAGSVPAQSPQSPRTPATQPTAGVGAFVWHDLVTPDPERCRAFYSALFGWTFESGQGVDPGYTIIKHAGQQIGGIVQRKPAEGEEAVGQWLSYVVVADVDRATEAFRAGGGRVYRGPLNARKDLRIAVVADPQGAPLGLASRGPRVDTDGPPGVNRWLWMEYVARDPEAALTFYGEVVGYRHEVQDTRQNFTYYLLSTDRPRAGLFRSLWERDASAWLPYVRVDDPAATAARAVELGGRILLAPGPSVRNSSLAIVLDPTGAAVALQQYPFSSGATP